MLSPFYFYLVFSILFSLSFKFHENKQKLSKKTQVKVSTLPTSSRRKFK